MKVPTAIGGTALRARLTAVGYGALILLAIATLSACSGGSTPSESSFTIISSLTSAGSASPAVHPASGSTSPASHAATVTVTPTRTVTVTAHANSSSPMPAQAPVTGGGGTAGFQDGLLLAIGASAIAAGAGSIAYRRRLTKRG